MGTESQARLREPHAVMPSSPGKSFDTEPSVSTSLAPFTKNLALRRYRQKQASLATKILIKIPAESPAEAGMVSKSRDWVPVLRISIIEFNRCKVSLWPSLCMHGQLTRNCGEVPSLLASCSLFDRAMRISYLLRCASWRKCPSTGMEVQWLRSPAIAHWALKLQFLQVSGHGATKSSTVFGTVGFGL
ncbi:hypothetical protein H6P81_009880 [Aristolochia fimbriata]|uniref:Uncharacterized protein n=1 Tax=Aristolochia fimbriata TaxID=158543 RepID=A0AAV7EM86_ARIFI|nr:hypothetical protein H6P81_009880 [Aristolochia fimbriata]